MASRTVKAFLRMRAKPEHVSSSNSVRAIPAERIRYKLCCDHFVDGFQSSISCLDCNAPNHCQSIGPRRSQWVETRTSTPTPRDQSRNGIRRLQIGIDRGFQDGNSVQIDDIIFNFRR